MSLLFEPLVLGELRLANRIVMAPMTRNRADADAILADLPKVERAVIVGGGYIGLELGTVYRKLGCEVTVVEAQERILPAYDAELTKPVATHLEKSGVKLLTGHSVLGLADNGQLRVRDKDGKQIALDADQILVAVGRRPHVEALGLKEAGVALDDAAGILGCAWSSRASSSAAP